MGSDYSFSTEALVNNTLPAIILLSNKTWFSSVLIILLFFVTNCTSVKDFKV